ncbi:MAG: dTDP-4-dehydrorhamnose 3,5-epimerase [Gemmatimonadaceae bacterium]
MKIVHTPLPGVLVIEPAIYRDARGFFLESFHDDRFAKHGLPVRFRQDNHSRSTRGVLRGLHYQIRHPQGKLVTAVSGEVFDVAVDVRRGSPTFGRWTGVTLSGDNPRYVWVPPGFAHGFCVLSDVADFVYKCTDVYTPGDEAGVLWNDPAVGIEWPIPHPILSDKDSTYAPLTPTRTDLPQVLTEAVGA